MLAAQQRFTYIGSACTLDAMYITCHVRWMIGMYGEMGVRDLCAISAANDDDDDDVYDIYKIKSMISIK